MQRLKICLAQLEVIPRQPTLNMLSLKNAIDKASEENADILVASEQVIPGYLIGDHWERPAFLKDCEAALKDLCEYSKKYPSLSIFIGTVRMDWRMCNEDGRIRKYNCAVVVENGKVVFETVKTLQPNYREFDDDRHFYSNRKLANDTNNIGVGIAKVTSVNGIPVVRTCVIPNFRKSIFQKIVKFTENGVERSKNYSIGVILCEDGWDTDYTIHPIKEMSSMGVDFIVNISCSPYTYGKNSKRNRVFGSHAKMFKMPIVYVNNVGVQNNGKNVFTFDGNSCIYDKFGLQLNPAPSFSPFVETFDVDLNEPFGQVKDVYEDISTLWNALVYGTDKFCQNLKIKKVVIGASGGIDSALSAVLFSTILGKDGVVLVNMPSRYNSDLTKNAAKKLAENLGVRYYVVPIEDSVNLTNKQMTDVGLPLTEFMLQNVQARDRSSRILAAVASSEGGVFTCNANKSEAMVGYTTLYGDLGGFFAPLGDLWKTQIYELARYVNAVKGNPIPEETINVMPSAELSETQDVTKGKGDPIIYDYHDKLFASWIERWNRATPEECLEWYMNGTLAKEIGYDEEKLAKLFPTPEDFIKDLEKWWNLYDGFAIAKRIQAPPILSLSRRSLGYDMRECQEIPYYSKKYLDMRKKILG